MDANDCLCSDFKKLDVKDDSTPKIGSELHSQISNLLQSTPLTEILQFHSKILTVDSTVPIHICLKALSHYHKDLSFVYNTRSMNIIGYVDEVSIVKAINDFKNIGNINCGEFIEKFGNADVHKLPEDSDSLTAFQTILRGRLSRLFVWSKSRNSPLGYLTLPCFLCFIVKNLSGRYDQFEDIVESIMTSEYAELSSEATLKDALEILVKNDNVAIMGANNKIVGLLNCKKVVYFMLGYLKKNEPVKFSTTVNHIVNNIDKQLKDINYSAYVSPASRQQFIIRVEPNALIKNAVVDLILSNDRILVYNRLALDVELSMWSSRRGDDAHLYIPTST